MRVVHCRIESLRRGDVGTEEMHPGTNVLWGLGTELWVVPPKPCSYVVPKFTGARDYSKQKLLPYIHFSLRSAAQWMFPSSPQMSNLWIILGPIFMNQGLPWWLSGKESTCQCRRRRFNPWVWKIHWRRKRQPLPVAKSRAWFSDWRATTKIQESTLSTHHGRFWIVVFYKK